MKRFRPSSRAFFAVAQALSLAVLFLICGSAAFAQYGAPPDLDAYVARAMKTFDVPGISVAIVKDGKVVVAKGYGVRKLGEPAPVDENTLFGIGSNTKAFTTALLATLVDEGKIAWDDPVYSRLPGFEMYDPYVSHEMTIRDLLCHRSGMGLGEGDLLFWPHTTYTRDEIIHKLRYMKPASSFRSHYAYDNLMYIAAGQIIPTVTGKSWEEYVSERILTPLGMTTTNLSNTAFKPGSDYAWPHSKLDTGKTHVVDFVALDNAAPAGSINSSAAEMAKWVQLQLNRGKFVDREGRIFSEQRSREMWSAQTLLPIGNAQGPLAAMAPKFAAYALGWSLRDYRGRKLVGHSGGVEGFVSRVMLVPEENLGVVVLTNAEEAGAFESILFHVLDHYFGAPETDWIAAMRSAEETQHGNAEDLMKKREAERAADSKPSLREEKCVGKDEGSWDGTGTISMEDGKLVMRLDHTPKAVGELRHWQYDTFVARWKNRSLDADAYVTFSLRPDGTIGEAKMEPVSPLTDFSFDFQDLVLRRAGGI